MKPIIDLYFVHNMFICRSFLLQLLLLFYS